MIRVIHRGLWSCSMTISDFVLLAQGGRPAADAGGLGGSFVVIIVLGIAAIAGLFLLIAAIAFAAYGKLWFRAYMSSADLSMLSLIAMGFRQVNSQVIVQAKLKAAQAGP